MSLYVPGGAPALKAPRSYGSKPITAQSYEGHTTVTGTPSPDNPATLTPVEPPAVPGAARQIGPLWSLPDGTRDTYDGETGVLVRRVGKIVLDGTEDWWYAHDAHGIGGFLAAFKEFIGYGHPLCTHFESHIPTNAEQNTITFIDPYQVVFIWHGKSDVAEFKAFLAAQKAAGTPVAFAWKLAQPAVEHIVYTGPITTLGTEVLAPSWEGKATVTGTPSPESPAAITGVPFAATATGPNGQTRSVDLGFTGYSLPDGARDTYDGVRGDFVQRVGKLVLDGSENWALESRGVRENTITILLEIGVGTDHGFDSAWCTHLQENVGLPDNACFGIYTFPELSKTVILVIPLSLLTTHTVEAAKSWLSAQAAAGTPVTVYYELAEPTAYNRKMDITAFDGVTTVTGADTVEVIEGRVLRVADCLPFEIVRNNRNLFDNPYLTVNQRGQIRSGNYIIGPDRWRINQISYDAEKEEITILDPAGDVPKIYQTCEAERTKSSVLTFSVLLGNNLYTLTTYNRHQLAVLDMDIGLLIIHAIDKMAINKGIQHFELRPEKLPVGSKLPKPYFKLEEGAEQTLARKIGDQWVLNDPPPDPALELLKCQMYQIALNSGLSAYARFGQGIAHSKTYALIQCPVPTTMRAKPIIQYNGSIALFNSGNENYPVSNIIVDEYNRNIVNLGVSVNDSVLDTGKTYALLAGNDRTADIILDANL